MVHPAEQVPNGPDDIVRTVGGQRAVPGALTEPADLLQAVRVVARGDALSPLTAKTHVSRIMTKLNARDRAQLVVIAYESGLVAPGGRR